MEKTCGINYFEMKEKENILKTSQLQSLIAKNSMEITALEHDVRSYQNAREYRTLGEGKIYWSRKLRNAKREIAKLASIQRVYREKIRDNFEAERLGEIKKPVQPHGVGDINGTTKGSGARYNGGKADLSLIPLETLYGEAEVWMYGAQKYSRNNWKRGMVWSIPLACTLRHLAKWQAGEENDQESGLPHLDHAMCNLRMLKYYATAYPEGDDRK